MGDGFHHPFVQGEGCLQQGFAVAGGAGTDNSGPFRQAALQLPDGKLGGEDGVSLVVGVELIQKLPIFANQRQFGGGGACVNAQVAVAPVGFQICFFHHCLGMAAAESLIFLFFPEQRLQPGHFELNLHALLQLLHQGSQRNGLLLLCFQGSAHGGKQVGILRVNSGFLCQMQRADKGCL